MVTWIAHRIEMLEMGRGVVPHWFQCGSGLAFYLNADPDPGQTFKSQKVDFYLHKKQNT